MHGCFLKIQSTHLSVSMGRIIIIAGPPGAGKSTTSKLVAAANPGAVRIEGDTFFHVYNYSKGIPKPWNLIVRSMVAAALPFAKEGIDVFIDFAMSPLFLETVKKIVAGRNIELVYFIIQPSLELCAHRAATREFGKIEDYEGTTEMYHKFRNFPTHHIGNDDSTPEELAELICSEYMTGKFAVV